MTASIAQSTTNTTKPKKAPVSREVKLGKNAAMTMLNVASWIERPEILLLVMQSKNPNATIADVGSMLNKHHRAHRKTISKKSGHGQSGWTEFCRAFLKKAKAKGENPVITKVAQLAADEWSTMSDKDKAVYKQMAKDSNAAKLESQSNTESSSSSNSV